MASASGEKIATTTPKQTLHLAEIFSFLNSKFPQLKRKDLSDKNDVESADMIEIEIPLVGSEFTRNFNSERIKNEIDVNKESVEDYDQVPEGYVEISIMPSTTTETHTNEITDFQGFPGDTTTFQNYFETFSPNLYTTGEKSVIKSYKLL